MKATSELGMRLYNTQHISENTEHHLYVKTRVVCAATILCKYLWILILLPKQLQLPIIAMIAIYSFDFRTVKFDLASGCMLLGFLVQSSAIVIQVLFHHPEQSRLYAAINTDFMWLFSIMIYMSASQISWVKDDLVSIVKWLTIDLLFLGILYLVYRIHPNLSFSFAGELHKISGGDYMHLDREVSGMGIRFRGFMETYLSPSHMFLIIFPLIVIIILSKRKHLMMSLLPVFMSYIACMASHSRTGMVVCTASITLGIICILIGYGSDGRFTKIILLLLCPLLLVLASYFYRDLASLINSFFNARQGSNDARFEVYRLSLEKVLTESPLLGIGIKYSYTADIPLGSHSTYIGMLYKSGFLGTMFYGSGFLILFHRLLRRCRTTRMGSHFFILLCMYPLFLIFSDIDGSNWVIALAFLLWGVICALPDDILVQGDSHGEIF